MIFWHVPTMKMKRLHVLVRDENHELIPQSTLSESVWSRDHTMVQQRSKGGPFPSPSVCHGLSSALVGKKEAVNGANLARFVTKRAIKTDTEAPCQFGR